jgi:hypothetical protein
MWGRIRVNYIFFKFQFRERQCFVIHQGHDGKRDIGRTAAPTRISTNYTNKKKESQEGLAKGGEGIVIQLSRKGRQILSTLEKSPACQTQNDEPLPKVNWYLSHI